MLFHVFIVRFTFSHISVICRENNESKSVAIFYLHVSEAQTVTNHWTWTCVKCEIGESFSSQLFLSSPDCQLARCMYVCFSLMIHREIMNLNILLLILRFPSVLWYSKNQFLVIPICLHG